MSTAGPRGDTDASRPTDVPRLGTGPPEQILRRLELAVTRRLDGLLQGDYRGLVPGHGSEAGETRRYVAGDDVRRIDWNVTARMQQPHVRETIADRELETWLLVDLSPSVDFGTALCTKRDLSVAAAAAVAFLTGRSGNRVGAHIVTPDGIVTVPARSGRAHVRSLMHRVMTAPRHDGGGARSFGQALARMTVPSTRRGLAVVVSDFLSREPWERTLRLVGTRHEALAVEVLDPRELDLPDVGLLALVDPETGALRHIRTDDAGLRARYRAAAHAQRTDNAAALRRARADHLVLRTDRDWLIDLVRFVALRRRRVDHLRRSTGGNAS